MSIYSWQLFFLFCVHLSPWWKYLTPWPQTYSMQTTTVEESSSPYNNCGAVMTFANCLTRNTRVQSNYRHQIYTYSNPNTETHVFTIVWCDVSCCKYCTKRIPVTGWLTITAEVEYYEMYRTHKHPMSWTSKNDIFFLMENCVSRTKNKTSLSANFVRNFMQNIILCYIWKIDVRCYAACISALYVQSHT